MLFRSPYHQLNGGGEGATDSDYANTIKKVKKENITKQNILQIMLSQIPSVSTKIASAISKEFTNMEHLVTELKNNPNCLKNIMMDIANGKKRKISKTSIQNITNFLVS